MSTLYLVLTSAVTPGTQILFRPNITFLFRDSSKAKAQQLGSWQRSFLLCKWPYFNEVLYRFFRGFLYSCDWKQLLYEQYISLNMWQEPFGKHQNMLFPGKLQIKLKISVYHLVKLLKNKRKSIIFFLYSTNGFSLNRIQAAGAPMRPAV